MSNKQTKFYFENNHCISTFDSLEGLEAALAGGNNPVEITEKEFTEKRDALALKYPICVKTQYLLNVG